MTSRRPRYTLPDGFRMPMGFPIEGLASGQRYRPEPGDVGMPGFVRKGVVGVWQSPFTLGSCRGWPRSSASALQGTGIAQLWPDLAASALK